MFVKHHDAGIPCFHVGSKCHKRFFVVGNREVGTFCSFCLEWDGGEQIFDILFHLIHIHITYHNDTLQVGTIPFVVISPDLLRLEVVDHIDATDWHTLGIFAVGIHFGKQLVPDSLLCATAGTPLFTDHTPFVFQFLIFQCDGIRPVMQYQQGRIHQVGIGRGNVGHEIDRLVERGVGIDVGAKFNAVVLQIVEHVLAGEVLCPVKSHVFEEVSQTGLVVFFLHRSNLLSNVKISSVFRESVVPDVISESVFQFTRSHVGVNWKRWILLCHGNKTCYQKH